jgi:phosphatidylethanolamine/phosphatidyl-N-methylethanolamine N-methyltransferase
MEIGHFIKAFIKNPQGVSTIFPASKSLSKAMAICSEVKEKKIIVEIGVGTGALTEAMLPLMGAEHSYTGFEIDKTFYKFLNDKFVNQHKDSISKLKNFEFKSDSAESIASLFEEASVDVVVSSLPWSIFEPGLQNSILNEVYKIMKPGGVFSFYNYMTSSQFGQIKSFKSQINKRFSSLEPKKRVWANLPPATVWVAKK